MTPVIVGPSGDLPALNESSIFICYRREDARADARLIYERVAAEFGANRVFKDLDKSRPGHSYVKEIQGWIDRSDAMLVLIGRGWLGAQKDGRPRLEQSTDPVRSEIAAALARKSELIVIPVLLGDATMPAKEELPEELQELTDIDALVAGERHWDLDLQELVNVLHHELEGTQSGQATRPATGATGERARGVLEEDRKDPKRPGRVRAWLRSRSPSTALAGGVALGAGVTTLALLATGSLGGSSGPAAGGNPASVSIGVPLSGPAVAACLTDAHLKFSGTTFLSINSPNGNSPNGPDNTVLTVRSKSPANSHLPVIYVYPNASVAKHFGLGLTPLPGSGQTQVANSVIQYYKPLKPLAQRTLTAIKTC